MPATIRPANVDELSVRCNEELMGLREGTFNSIRSPRRVDVKGHASRGLAWPTDFDFESSYRGIKLGQQNFVKPQATRSDE